jgi:DNA-binding helix-hairpin-helix protein with protein kinase domain
LNSLLKSLQMVRTESSGLPCIVEDYLGGGGQGEVYRAWWAGETVALKWYFAHQATREQRSALEDLIKIGSPTESFLWPLELASNRTSARGFGYVMPLRDPRFKSIVDLMKRRAEPGFHSLVTACIGLADSYLRLHALGLCYRDISFGNVFFDPDSGDVLICDNDNVGVDGTLRAGVLGTPRFMAPEVVRAEAPPSIHTDLYSLAVLLFYLLMVHHPLEGKREAAIKCLDLPAMNRLYGDQPLFIFHPFDSSNAPLPTRHANALAFWPIYPRSIRQLFTRAFVDGLNDPAKRVRESEWRTALARLRDQIFYCECGQENFYCSETHRETGAYARACWSCGRLPKLPLRLQIGVHQMMLNWDTRLFPHHIEPDLPYDFTAPAAEMTENPNRPGQWGLKNLSNCSWRVFTAEGQVRGVDPGRSVALAMGTRIDFGRAHGEVIF